MLMTHESVMRFRAVVLKLYVTVTHLQHSTYHHRPLSLAIHKDIKLQTNLLQVLKQVNKS